MSIGPLDPYPRLLGDIGGTYARFAIATEPGARPGRVRTLVCADYAGPEQAIRAYLDLECVELPAVAAFGIANPITGDLVAMTNHQWRFSIEALRCGLGLERLLLINDFTALALALPLLQPSEVEQVGAGAPQPDQPIGLIGAGTGLGVSGLLPGPGGHVPLTGEGGHVSLPATNDREASLIALLAQRYGHVSAERVLSGPGLVALHDAIRQLDGAPPETLASAEISRRGLAASCPHCVDTLSCFCAMLGTVAGNLALTLGAHGGVYVGGGIVPRLGHFFSESAFRQRFESKGRFSAYLGRIPTYVIHASNPALLGASRALDLPFSGTGPTNQTIDRSHAR